MNNIDSPEMNADQTKEAALFGYKKFVDAGATNPADVPTDAPEHELFYEWQKQLDARAGDDEEKQKQASIEKTMFYIDAGFNDPDYLDEVLNDWLAQDAEEAEKDSDNPARQETRRQIANAMLKVRKIIAEKTE